MRKRSVAAIVAAGVLGAGAVSWRWLHLTDLTHIGTGYAAQQTCACLFISGRTLESCLGDLDPLARKLVSVKPGAAEVTASSLGFVRATARYEKGFGCAIRP
jgi:hypothetical protein